MSGNPCSSRPCAVSPGLALLDIETTMSPAKQVRPVQGACARTGARVAGYEIHAGRTSGADCGRPVLTLEDGPDGARSASGRIWGCYVHGLFAADEFRRNWLSSAGAAASHALSYEASVDQALDDLADGLAAAIDIDALLGAARPIGWTP